MAGRTERADLVHLTPDEMELLAVHDGVTTMIAETTTVYSAFTVTANG